MKFATVLVLAILVLLGCARVESRPPRSHELSLGYSFEEYTNDFGKVYPNGSSEWLHRRALFYQRLSDILNHNRNPLNTYKRGVNQFSDWTEKEWKNYNLARVTPTSKLAGISVFKGTERGAEYLPRTVDYRKSVLPNILTGVKNQGHCGNCWAHAATEAVESFFAIKFGQLPVLSTQQITSCTSSMWGCGGGEASQAWLYVRNSTGLNEEWVYPFVDFFCPHLTRNATAICKNVTKEWLPSFPWFPKANVTNFTRVTTNDANATMEALATIGPLAVSVAAHKWNDYESGIFQDGNTSDSDDWSVDHAVQLVGYGHDESLGKNYWVVRNSWGTSWGESGFIRLLRPDVEPCGTSWGETVCGTSAILCAPEYPEVEMLKRKNI